MRITILGATGALGQECTLQALAAGHEVTVLARTPAKLADAVRERVHVVEGDALVSGDVDRALPEGTQAVLFAIGVDKRSPENLCADVTRSVFDAMRRKKIGRFVWCGGGSNMLPKDVVTLGSRFVTWFASTFMGLRHRDKVRQLDYLGHNKDIVWIGLRPLQMNPGPRREIYRLGYDAFSGLSKITFADCAHAMLVMLEDDTWIHEAPIIQY